MPVTIKQLPKSEVSITVEVESERAQEFFDKALRALAATLELKGFRRGKVPASIARGHVSQKDILEKGVEIAVGDTYPDIVTSQKLETVGPPQVNVLKVAKGSPLVYEARVAVLPKVILPDYRKTNVTRHEVSVGEDEVAKSLDWLRKSRAKYKAVNRAAARGDQVEVDFTSRLAGVLVEGGSAKKYSFTLGEKKFVRGFEDGIVGMSVGEDKSFPVEFPRDYPQKHLAGKTVDFEVKLSALQEVEFPEANDAFAKQLGSFQDLEALKTNTREGLTQEKEAKETQRVRGEILDNLISENNIEVPDVLLERELDKMTEELKRSIEGSGLKFEDYMRDVAKKDISALREDWKVQAEKRVKSALFLLAIAKKEGIEASAEEVEERLNRDVLSGYASQGEAEKEVDLEGVREYIRGVVKNEKTLEFLEKLATKK